MISENETLSSIVVLPLYFVENYLFLSIFTTFLKIDFSKKRKLIYIIFVSLITIFDNFIIGEPINVIVNYLIIFILLFVIYKLSFIKSILAIILPFIVFGVVNTVIMNPFLKAFSITFETTEKVPIYHFMYLFVIYFMIFIILQLVKFKNFHFKIHGNFDKAMNKIFLQNLVLGIITLFMQAVLTYYYINMIPIWMTVINIILLLSYFFLSFYSLTKATRLYITTQELENSESYNKTLSILYDNVKGFKHDFDNMVNTIGGYINLNDMKGLKKYYSDLRKESIDLKNISLLNPNIINNPGIYNLLVSEYQKALNEGVKINFEFFFDFNNLHMPIYEFARILGILLDNAIDAAKECDEKIINLLFRDSSKNNVQIISVENTYLDKNIDTNKIFDKGFSGKEKHTGIGLWEVKQIEKKYNNIILNTSKDDKYFKQQLEIYY